jgi:hypothetical protein
VSAKVVYNVAKADATVYGLLIGEQGFRFYGFGEAPEKIEAPYAVWQVVGGFPENRLADRPGEDTYTVQIDAYAKTEAKATELGEALRYALELSGYLTGYNFEAREPTTRLCRYSFTMDFMVSR